MAKTERVMLVYWFEWQIYDAHTNKHTYVYESRRSQTIMCAISGAPKWAEADTECRVKRNRSAGRSSHLSSAQCGFIKNHLVGLISAFSRSSSSFSFSNFIFSLVRPMYVVVGVAVALAVALVYERVANYVIFFRFDYFPKVINVCSTCLFRSDNIAFYKWDDWSVQFMRTQKKLMQSSQSFHATKWDKVNQANEANNEFDEMERKNVVFSAIVFSIHPSHLHCTYAVASWSHRSGHAYQFVRYTFWRLSRNLWRICQESRKQ